jgi:hypothetical protein
LDSGNADEESDGLGSRIFVERHRDLLADVEYLLTEGGDVRVEKGKVRWFGVGVGEKQVGGNAAVGLSVPQRL